MPLLNLCLNFFLAFPLLWINGALGKWKLHSYGVFGYSDFGFNNISEENFFGNFFQMIVHPAIYLALISWTLQQFSLNDIVLDLWLVIPFYWLLRVTYAILKDTFVFTNWRTQLIAFILSILLGEGTLFCIIRPLVINENSVFIDAKAFRDAFWFAVLAYLAKWLWDTVKIQFIGEELFPSQKKKETIIRRYTKYHRKYGAYINGLLEKECFFKSPKQKAHFLCLIYAIMIYEAHNRPRWARATEYFVKLFCPCRTISLGIMQVQTKGWISNKKSIHLATKKLYAAFSTAAIEQKLEASIMDYNPSCHYFEQVVSIYKELCKHLGLPAFGRHCVKVSERKLVHHI